MNGTHITGSSDFNDTLLLEPIQAENSPYLTESLMRPEDVVATPKLRRTEKRELLASWASDARAVPNAPELRQLDNGSVVRIDDILCALRSLDASEISQHIRWKPSRSSSLRIRVPKRMKAAFWRSRSDDDDDDPPPCPAMNLRPIGGPLSSGAAAGLRAAA